MKQGFFRRHGLAIACAVLASCGGGGGGGDADPDAENSSKLTFTPPSLEIVQTEGVEEEVELSATISPVPEGNFFAVIAADKPVVETGEAFFVITDDDSATVTLRTERTLPVGTHQGRLTVRLCRDAQCKDEISLRGNALPYSIKVLPPVKIVASGAIEPGSDDETYVIASGTIVVLKSNIPVIWRTGSLTMSARVEEISSTPRRWEGRFIGSSSAFIGIEAIPVEEPGGSELVLFTFR